MVYKEQPGNGRRLYGDGSNRIKRTCPGIVGVPMVYVTEVGQGTGSF